MLILNYDYKSTFTFSLSIKLIYLGHDANSLTNNVIGEWSSLGVKQFSKQFFSTHHLPCHMHVNIICFGDIDSTRNTLEQQALCHVANLTFFLDMSEMSTISYNRPDYLIQSVPYLTTISFTNFHLMRACSLVRVFLIFFFQEYLMEEWRCPTMLSLMRKDIIFHWLKSIDRFIDR